MKLLLKEYLSSLKERGELDAILPDLLSEMGLHVFSRPAIGPRQNGVDLAAVGVDGDNVRKVFLLTVKSGNLTRDHWDTGKQAVRPSLNEILDSFIPRRIPKEYAGLPVAICICVGGDIHQNVDSDVSDYEKRFSEPGKIGFQRWDGDKLANFMLSAVLGENVVSGEARSLFRKSVALLDEPDAAYEYFAEMISKLKSETGPRQKDIVSFVRQLNLCCWVLYVWARQAGNLEAPYRCSELAMLWAWDATSDHLGKRTAPAKAMGNAVMSLFRLHFSVANELVSQKYLPSAGVRDGLASAVNSPASLDVNLRLYEALGRIAMTGIWLQFFAERHPGMSAEEVQQTTEELDAYANGLISIINNNGALRVPALDSNSIEVSLVCIFLAMRRRHDAIVGWTSQLLSLSLFAVHFNKHYPCVFTDYHELLDHPQPASDQEYFERATTGSTLYPTLCAWQKLIEPAVTFPDAAGIINRRLQHCTMQLWSPNEASEEHLYTHSDIHGLAVVGLSITESCDELIEIIFEEARQSDKHFRGLSAVSTGHWPVVLSACRHHRVTVPVNFWADMFALPVTNSVEHTTEQSI